MADVTVTEIEVAQSRSDGNARILKHLVSGDRGLLDPSKIDNLLMLDDLLNEGIETALGQVRRQGYKEEAMPSSLVNYDSVMLESGFPRKLRNTRPVPSLSLCTSCRIASACPESGTR